MRLLVTRPHDDAVSFAELLRARGHIPIVAPIMDVRPHDGPPIALEGVQALLATSANGVRALTLRTRKRNIALYAVGPQTAEAAKSFKVETMVLYDAVPASELPDTAKDALREGTLDGVLLFSPRSAKTFATLTTEAKLEASCGRLDAFCISAATAAALSPLSFARVSVA